MTDTHAHDWQAIYWKLASLASDGGQHVTLEYCRICGILRLPADELSYMNDRRS